MAGVRLGTIGAVLALGALAACGSSSGTGTATPTPSAAGVTQATVPLRHVPEGAATLAYDPATRSLTVELRLVGLAPNSVHPAHIHSGRCESQGPVAYALHNVQADGHGVADQVSVVGSVTEGGIPDGAWYVNVHNGPDLSPEAQFEPIVCGDIANPGKGGHAVVQLQSGPPPTSPPGSPDQSASGTARLRIVDGRLQVMLDAGGLRPSSSHAVHIHLGSCESQGAVVHPLPALRADATGHATLTATVDGVGSIPSGVWYLNIHRDTMITSGQTDFDPILCGDIGGSPGY